MRNTLIWLLCVILLGCGKNAGEGVVRSDSGERSDPTPQAQNRIDEVDVAENASEMALEDSKGVREVAPFWLEIEAMDIARISHVLARYVTMKRIPEGEYQDWQMKALSVFSRTVIEAPTTTDETWVELSVLVKNVGNSEETFHFKDVHLSLPDGQKLTPWEHLFSGVFNGYEQLAEHLSLSENAPKPGSTAIQMAFKGDFYCVLKPKQKTWFVLVFCLPRGAKDATLIVGSAKPVPLKIPTK